MEANEDVVRFTAKELLARLDVKLDELVKQVDVRIGAIDHRVQEIERMVPSYTEFRVAQAEVNRDRETRLRSLERKVYIIAGAAAAGGGTLSAVAQYLAG